MSTNSGLIRSLRACRPLCGANGSYTIHLKSHLAPFRCHRASASPYGHKETFTQPTQGFSDARSPPRLARGHVQRHKELAQEPEAKYLPERRVGHILRATEFEYTQARSLCSSARRRAERKGDRQIHLPRHVRTHQTANYIYT